MVSCFTLLAFIFLYLCSFHVYYFRYILIRIIYHILSISYLYVLFYIMLFILALCFTLLASIFLYLCSFNKNFDIYQYILFSIYIFIYINMYPSSCIIYIFYFCYLYILILCFTLLASIFFGITFIIISHYVFLSFAERYFRMTE